MWFRKDLRLDDNTALRTALFSLDKHDELLCVFQLNPTQFKTNTLTHDYFFQPCIIFLKKLKMRIFPFTF
ncbi:MAG: deoxyribodipyrimidine photo-lyase [Vagococcus sp.]